MNIDVAEQRNGDESFLALLSLTDSALATGTFAHSFGLESMVNAGYVDQHNLADFIHSWVEYQLGFEAAFCLEAHRIVCRRGSDADSISEAVERLAFMNQTLDAFKLSRENRLASTRTGGRLLQLVDRVCGTTGPQHNLLMHAKIRASHHCIAFGLACAMLGVPEIDCVLSLFQQNTAAMISAAQRLLPLGQLRAAEITWQLKPLLAKGARSILNTSFDEIVANGTFSPQLEAASMNHPYQNVRLFLS